VRPQRLIMEGFLAYRRRTEIDFSDADLFVLAGPTGSGKSSVIDGMTFALYGSIPRVGKGSVAPLISAQAESGRVEFRFSVGDESYTAVRLMVRQGSGATTTEARLLRGESQEVLAGTADEVTDAVTNLLGLRYEHFIKAVVLPQGAFADFLTDQPRDRQALLGALLDMGLYEQVMQLANQRAKLAEGRAKSVGDSLAKLDVVSPEQLEEASRVLAGLAGARAELPARLEARSRLDGLLGEARSRHAAAVESLTRLRAIEVPDDLDTLDTDRAAAAEHLESVETSLAGAIEAGREIDEAIAGHPQLAILESARADRLLYQDLVGRRSQLALESLTTAVGEITANRDEMRRAIEALRVEHAAHDLRRGLVVGDNCPVCQSVVATIAEETSDPNVSLDQLAAELRALEERADRVRDGLKEAEGQAKQIDRQLEELAQRLDGAADLAALEEAITTVNELVESKDASERVVTEARLTVEQARLVVSDLNERSSGLLDALLAVRDRVAGEKPPLPGNDAIEAWRQFVIWLTERTATLLEELDVLEKSVEVAAEASTTVEEGLRSWLEQYGIASTESPDRDLALVEAGKRAEIEEMEKNISHAHELEEELAMEKGQIRVASTLGNHLKANNFEAWLLEEAMEVLIDGANHLLDELSGGGYSLRVRKSQFEVVDHRNAQLTRTTRTLSGGELFLVALSLALTMAEQLAELTGMSSRLESVFLDEGFGSLDQESLDVVASVLDELVGRGRTIGIVTHVRELAERMPVRFEVTKGPETSSIARVGE
jgi:DNA repair protein SbcC/Rad50